MKNRVLLFLFVAIAPGSFAQKVYSITDFGAKGDDNTINTKPIQDAIDKCAADGGGEVLIPTGTFLCGTIYLKNYVTLYLSAPAILKGIAAVNAFSKNAFIWAEGQH